MPWADDARWHSILPRNGCQEQLGSITIIIEVIQSCTTEGIIRVIINQNQTWSSSFSMREHIIIEVIQSCALYAWSRFVYSTLPCFHSPISNNTSAPCLLKYVQYLQPEPPATSAARCLIISMTAALRRESACCCILRKCSFKSLYKGKKDSKLYVDSWNSKARTAGKERRRRR